MHDSMALRVCGEILKDHTAPEVRLYAKTLNNLEVGGNEGTRQEVHALLQEVAQVTPTNGVARVTPTNRVTQVTPTNGVTQVTPTNGVARVTPTNGVTQVTPTNGVKHRLVKEPDSFLTPPSVQNCLFQLMPITMSVSL